MDSSILNQLSLGVLVEDADGNIVLLNDAARSLLAPPDAPPSTATSAAEWLTDASTSFEQPATFLDWVDSGRGRPTLTRVGSKIQPLQPRRFRTRAGHEIEVCARLMDAESIGHRLWEFLDLSAHAHAQKLLANSAERLQALVTSAPEGIICMDARGRVREFNPAAEALLGWKREQVLGRLLAETIVPEELRSSHLAGIERVKGGGRSQILGRRITVPALTIDGTSRTIHLMIVKMDLEGEGGAWFVAYMAPANEEA